MIDESWHSYRTESKKFSLSAVPIYDWDVSENWRLAPNQYEYFSNSKNGYINGDVITISSKKDIKKKISGIQSGDLMYFSRKNEGIVHAAIISKVDKNDIYFAGHTLPAFDKSLASVISKYEKISIIKLKDSVFNPSFTGGGGGGGVR